MKLLTLLTCRREQPGACCVHFVYLFQSEAGIQIADFQVDRLAYLIKFFL